MAYRKSQFIREILPLREDFFNQRRTIMKENQTFNLVATAASGLEALVGKELRDMGIECQVENGRARFQGTMETIAWIFGSNSSRDFSRFLRRFRS